MSEVITLVDDDRNMLLLLSMFLETERYTVRTYGDGVEQIAMRTHVAQVMLVLMLSGCASKYGTVGGAVGAVHGLSYMAYADSMAGVVVGAVAGSVLGAGAGVFEGVKDRETEIASCMREKGYAIVYAGA